MAYLIGSADTARFNSTHVVTGANRNIGAYNNNPEYTPVSSGQGSILSIMIDDWGSISQIKAALYQDSALVDTAIFDSSQGTGVIYQSVDVAISDASTYVLVLYQNQETSTYTLNTDPDNGRYLWKEGGLTGGSYDTPPDPLPSDDTASYVSTDEFYWSIQSASSGPSITQSDPVVDGAEATITTSGLSGAITATLGGYNITTAGTLPNLTYTTDIYSITANGPVSAPRIGESLTLSVAGDEGEATSTVAFNPSAGRAAVTLAGTLSNEADSLIDKMQNVSGLTVAVPDVMYYPTADNTDITTTGFLTSDSPSFTLILIKGGDADTAGSAYAFTVTPEAVTPVDPGDFPITRSVVKSVTRSVTKSIYRG